MVEAIVRGETPPMSGVLSFDGRILEVLGFTKEYPRRMHLVQIESCAVSFEKKGLLTMPYFSAVGRNGAIGIQQSFEPDEGERQQLEAFVAAVQHAISNQEVSA